MLHEIGGGTPLTSAWWLAAVVLLLLTIGASLAVLAVARVFSKKDQTDAAQTTRIAAVEASLHACQIQCARNESDLVKRIEFEGRLNKLERSITRVHQRVDQIALKLGLAPEEPHDA